MELRRISYCIMLGYPGANRSHFKSIALWETGGMGKEVGKTGWLTDDINGMKGADAVDAHGISLDGGMGVFASPDGTDFYDIYPNLSH